MLNRRILRIKAFKTLYSYAENPYMTLKEALSELEVSCQSTRDLYLFMLALVSPLTAEASSRIAAGLTKFNKTEEERNPNYKFTENKIAKLLDEDPDFQKLLAKKKFSWEQQDAFLRKLYENIRQKDYFKEYLASEERSVKEDAALFVRIFEEELVDSEDLEAILEDMSIYWNDDLAYSLTYCCKAMDAFARGKGWSLPPLYLSEINRKDNPDLSSDRQFVTTLLSNAFSGYSKYYDLVAAEVPKWDKDRLFMTDVAMIITGLAEAESFPDIPAKVTINEYVEISKYYGTPKSRSFVNGLLDKLIKNNLSLQNN